MSLREYVCLEPNKVREPLWRQLPVTIDLLEVRNVSPSTLEGNENGVEIAFKNGGTLALTASYEQFLGDWRKARGLP